MQYFFQSPLARLGNIACTSEYSYMSYRLYKLTPSCDSDMCTGYNIISRLFPAVLHLLAECACISLSYVTILDRSDC